CNMRAYEPVSPVFPHHDTLVDHFTAQAGEVIVEASQYSADFLLVIEPAPLERTRDLLHDVPPLFVLCRDAEQAPILYEGRQHARTLVAFRRQRLAGEERLRDVLRTLREALQTLA